MTFLEFADGGDDDVLALAVFELAAREDDEAIFPEVGFGGGVKEGAIDALDEDGDVL